MKINMTELQFNKLIQLCCSSRKELSGTMSAQIYNDELYINGVKLYEDEIIEESSSNEIQFNLKEYITKTVYELAFDKSPVYIKFHTHPLFNGAPGLSKADINNLKYVQGLTEKISKINSNGNITVIEGIITESEIAFYTYDLEKEKVVRLPFFVDGVEKIPSLEKSKFQLFKEGFLEGRRSAKR